MDVRAFISAYENERCLWDPSNLNYRTPKMRRSAFDRMVSEFGIPGKFDLSFCILL